MQKLSAGFQVGTRPTPVAPIGSPGYAANAGPPTTPTVIDPDWANGMIDEFGTIIALIPGTPGFVASDSAQLAKGIQSGQLNVAIDTGAVNAYVGQPPVAFVGMPAKGTYVWLWALNANTLASTYNTVGILRHDGAKLRPGDITVGPNLLVSDGTNWRTSRPGRTRALGNLTLNVSSTGNDTTGDGTTAAPFATLARAISSLYNDYDHNGFSPSIALAGSTTYNTPNITVGGGLTGTAGFTITGPSSAILNLTDSVAGFIAHAGAAVTIAGITVQGTADLLCAFGGTIFYSCNFGATGGAHMYSAGGGLVAWTGTNYTISGSAASHIKGGYLGNALMDVTGPLVITLTGTPAFSSGFIQMNGGSQFVFVSSAISFSGSATGPHYTLASCGRIITFGGGATVFPGSSAGTNDGSGTYQ